jgi:hypothetical protein
MLFVFQLDARAIGMLKRAKREKPKYGSLHKQTQNIKNALSTQ